MGAWHPKDNTFAVAKHNSLFIYSEKRSISTHDKKMMRDREREGMMQNWSRLNAIIDVVIAHHFVKICD